MITTLDKNTALILIDLQKSIVQLPLAKPVNGILENVARLLEVFHKKALPVVVVNVNPAGAAWTNTRKDSQPVRNVTFGEGGLEITPEIKVQPGDIFITKHTWSAFYETPLHEELQKRKITGIVLAGVSTSIGVEGTARGASERGYNISFAQDAMTDMFADAHENSLKYIFPRIGEVGNTDQLIEKLSLL